MRPLERRIGCAVLLALAAQAAFAQEASRYGKVETFEPGKKYNCVPTPDHKGWDCSESGKARIPPQAGEGIPEPPAPPAPSTPAPRDTAVSTPAAGTASDLPAYLANPAARMQPQPAAAPSKPAPRPRVAGPQIPLHEAGGNTSAASSNATPATPVQSAAPTSPAAMASPPRDAAARAAAGATAARQENAATPGVAAGQRASAATKFDGSASVNAGEGKSAHDAAPPAARGDAQAAASSPATAPDAPPPAQQPVAAAASRGAAAMQPASVAQVAQARPSGSESDFLQLAPQHYVIELARSASHAPGAGCPSGERGYSLYSPREDADAWLLVCGPYDSLAAAREAREAMLAQGANPGWPRRIGPLQSEIRNAAQ